MRKLTVSLLLLLPISQEAVVLVGKNISIEFILDLHIDIMNQQQVINILVIATIIIEGLVSIGACLYAIPLCVIRRFHTPLNLLTLNVCVAAFICATYWGIYFTMAAFYPRIFWTLQSCISLRYIQHMVISQLVYAFCMVSLNRLIAMVYRNKALFRTKKWIAICVSIQWVFAALLPLPVIDTDPYVI
jgi:hypothetical protein